MNTKLSVRDGEYNERKKLLRKKTEQLNKIRAKVREVIAADKELRDVIKDNISWDEEMDCDNNTREEGAESKTNIIQNRTVRLLYQNRL